MMVGPRPAIAKQRKKRENALVAELNKLLIGDSTTAVVDSPAQIDLTALHSSVGSSAPVRKPATRPKKMISASATRAIGSGVHQQPGSAGDATSSLANVTPLDSNAVSILSASQKKAIRHKQ